MQFPNINPIAINIGPLAIRWYGISYLVAFVCAWFLGRIRLNTVNSGLLTIDEFSDLLFYLVLGVIIGGRFGYMLWYAFPYLLNKPYTIFMIWQGGMSFHGGLLGVIIALFFSAKLKKYDFWEVADFIAPLVPIGLGCGRLANFVNGELWGRPTNQDWGVIFPWVDLQLRHPSQLYEMTFEGIILFSILWLYSKSKRDRGRVCAMFLGLYAVFRFCMEYFREPDAGLGLFFNNQLSMGQLLSIPMFIIALIIWCYIPSKK